LTFPQFALLSYFTQAPDRSRTITGIARVLRANQPKITKRIRQLVERGYLHVQPGGTDPRVKRLTTTPAGRVAFRAAGVRSRSSVFSPIGTPTTWSA
jgi:DNA-binding MarR family transcriptional regulator